MRRWIPLERIRVFPRTFHLDLYSDHRESLFTASSADKAELFRFSLIALFVPSLSSKNRKTLLFPSRYSLTVLREIPLLLKEVIGFVS